MKAVRLAPVMMDVVPSEVTRLLATADGKTFGYGWGPGSSIIFGSEHGDIQVEPGQWVVRADDGMITVQDEEPVDRERERELERREEARRRGARAWERSVDDAIWLFSLVGAATVISGDDRPAGERGQ
ncbi:MAG: hypothetical protein K0S37_773 [Microbacterium sp.]|jgi:hypothetical protein|nr:hypothetical protein [Microbacterium sp.]